MKLTVVVLTKNAERHLEQCLRSAQFADELLVLDGNSVDRTIRIADHFGANVVVRSETDFSALRNFALAKAANEYVFMLDTDEFIPAKLRDEIRQVLNQKAPAAAYQLQRINIGFGRPLRAFGKDIIVKLLRKNACHYEGRVHESPKIDGAVSTLSSHLIHLTYWNWAEYWRKWLRYTAVDVPERPLNQFGRAAHVFMNSYVTNRGYLDGFVGLTLSLASALYEIGRIRSIRKPRNNQ